VLQQDAGVGAGRTLLFRKRHLRGGQVVWAGFSFASFASFCRHVLRCV
jgi:hypothetical protein